MIHSNQIKTTAILLGTMVLFRRLEKCSKLFFANLVQNIKQYETKDY